MGFSIIPKNVSQSFNGGVFSTGEVEVLQGVGQIAYTVPTGKRSRVKVQAIITRLLLAENLRFRVAGILIKQHGINESIGEGVATGLSIDLGEWILNSGETVSCTTSNVGTEGGNIILNCSVLAEVPQ